MPVRESSVESYLRDLIVQRDGLCIKLSPAAYVGIPDRLVLLPGGFVCFAEVKKPRGGVIAPLQKWWRDRLTSLGFLHRFVFTKADADRLIQIWKDAP